MVQLSSEVGVGEEDDVESVTAGHTPATGD